MHDARFAHHFQSKEIERIIMKTLLTIIAVWILLVPSFQIGTIWHIRANPTKDVTVLFKNGEEMKGALSRTWLGDYTLTTADGNQYEFAEFNSMAFPAFDPNDKKQSFSVFNHWRVFILPIMIMAITLMFWFAPLFLSMAWAKKYLSEDNETTK